MHAPLLNINFCGTWQDPSRSDLASVVAIKQFDNRLLLSGIGAPDTTDPETKEAYPSPGSYYVDEQLKRQPSSPWFNRHFGPLIYAAGVAGGQGDRDNVDYAVAVIEKKLSQVAANSEQTINISGFSRGGAAAVALTNALYMRYGNRIKVNLFLIDPNAGVGRQHYQTKRNIPFNVEHFYVVFNRDEVLPVFKSLEPRHYVLNSASTSMSVLYVKGGHLAQEFLSEQPDGSGYSAAETNQALLELFYESHGATRIKPRRVLENMRDNCPVNRGFMSDRSGSLPLHAMIHTFKPIPSIHAERLNLREENAYLTRFNHAISNLKNRHYSVLGYYFMQMLYEIERMDSVTPEQQELAARCLQVTDNLIRAMTPGDPCSTPRHQAKALRKFRACMALDSLSARMRSIAAMIVGIVTGLVFGLAAGLGGFFVGLTRLETLGLASLPYAVVGTYNGVVSGYNWGREQTLGHQNAYKITKSINTIVNESPVLQENPVSVLA